MNIFHSIVHKNENHESSSPKCSTAMTNHSQISTTFLLKTNYLILVKKCRPVLLFHKPFCILMAQRDSVIQVPKPYDSAGGNISHIIRKFGTNDMKISQCH